MAKGQSRRPGRDVRGGTGKRGVGTPRGGYGAGGKGHGQGARGRSATGQGGRDAGRTSGGGARNGASTARGAGGRDVTDRGRCARSSHPRGGATYIEGRRAVAEALDAGVPIRRALVARGGEGADATLERLMARLGEAGVGVEAVPRSRLDSLSSHGAHQGIVLEAEPFAYASLDDIIHAADGETNALVVVLDHVSDEGNLGAIVRSGEVVGATGVVVARTRAAGVGAGAYKTSAGAVLHMPIAQVANIATAVGKLKEAGFWAIAATEHAERSVWDVPLEGRIALVMGSEGAGVSQLVRRRCDLACRLPQRGRVESLNVAQAATVLCYEWLRRSFGGRDVGTSPETGGALPADADGRGTQGGGGRG